MANGYYEDGTVSITSGTAAVVGVGTAFSTFGVQAGDKFVRNGYSIPILTVTDDTHLTLKWNYPGTTLAPGSTYQIEPLPDLTRTLQSTLDLVELLSSAGNIEALSGLTGAADKLAYFTGAGAMAVSDLPALARQFLATANSSNALWNLGLSASVGASALTVNLKQADGTTDPTATKPCMIGFRSATLTSGAVSERTATGAVTLTVPSTATLGQTSAVAGNLYVYAIDNAGTIELAIAGTDFGESGRVSTTVMNTASDDGATMYSTTARSNVAFRRIGLLVATEATAGTWATAPSTVQVAPTHNIVTSEFVKTLLDDTTLAAFLTSLGIPSYIQSILASTSRQSLLSTSLLAVSLGTISDDAVASIAIGTGSAGGLIGWHTNSPSNGGWFNARASSGNNAVEIAKASALTIGYGTGVPTGTTGTDGRLNFYVDTSGNLYAENRTGSAIPVTVYPLKLS
jgi:hypothetical protein